MDRFADKFEDEEIDGPSLLELTDKDMESLGIDKLGHRKALVRGINDAGAGECLTNSRTNSLTHSLTHLLTHLLTP